jgi:hypothetical protein
MRVVKSTLRDAMPFNNSISPLAHHRPLLFIQLSRGAHKNTMINAKRVKNFNKKVFSLTLRADKFFTAINNRDYDWKMRNLPPFMAIK